MKNFKANAIYLAFTILFVSVYFYFIIDPKLLYFNQQPLFLINNHFIYQFLKFPGGLSELISIFISQFYYYPLLGTLLFVVIQLIIYLLLVFIFKHFSNNSSYFFAIIPVIILTTLQNNYDHELFINIGFLFSLLGFMGFYYFQKRPIILRITGSIPPGIFSRCSPSFAFLIARRAMLVGSRSRNFHAESYHQPPFWMDCSLNTASK